MRNYYEFTDEQLSDMYWHVEGNEIYNTHRIPCSNKFSDTVRDYCAAKYPDVPVTEENLHITLMYGFDEIHYEEIDKYVRSQNVTMLDIAFTDVELRLSEKLKPHFVLGVESEKLCRMFTYLNGKYANSHGLINGEYVPHVTLSWLSIDRKECRTIPLCMDKIMLLDF